MQSQHGVRERQLHTRHSARSFGFYCITGECCRRHAVMNNSEFLLSLSGWGIRLHLYLTPAAKRWISAWTERGRVADWNYCCSVTDCVQLFVTPWSTACQACTRVHARWVSDADRRETLNSPGQLGPQGWEPLSKEPAPETLRWRRKVLPGAPRGPNSAQWAGLPSQGGPGVQGKRLLHASSLSLSPATKSPDLVSLESQFINFFVYSEGKKRDVHFYRWPWLEVFDEEVSRVKGSSWFIYVLIKWRHPSYIFFHISLMDVLLEINYTHTHTHSHTETPVAKSRSSSVYYNYFYCSTIPTYHTNNVMSFSDICLDF